MTLKDFSKLSSSKFVNLHSEDSAWDMVETFDKELFSLFDTIMKESKSDPITALKILHKVSSMENISDLVIIENTKNENKYEFTGKTIEKYIYNGNLPEDIENNKKYQYVNKFSYLKFGKDLLKHGEGIFYVRDFLIIVDAQ